MAIRVGTSGVGAFSEEGLVLMGARVFVLRTLVALSAVASVSLPADAFAGNVSFGSFPTTSPVFRESVTGPPSEIQSESATVTGSIQEGGTVTECAFEYGTRPFYGSKQECAETPEEINEGARQVHAELTGLTPGTTYHYRMILRYGASLLAADDKSFTTIGPPVVFPESLTKAGQTEAEVEAQINPALRATTYLVEYGTSEAYGHSTAEVSLASDDNYHRVTAHIDGLTPGTVYHFRFVATNELGTTDGADREFATFVPPTTGGCSNEERREEQNATHLPDCRAYEMVSPLDKKGSDIYAGTSSGSNDTTQLSNTGERAVFAARAGFGEVEGSAIGGYTTYVATRKEGQGWSTHGITPQPRPDDFQFLVGATTISFLSDSFEQAFISAYELEEGGEDIALNQNLYVEDTGTGKLHPLTTPVGVESSSIEPLAFYALSSEAAGSSDLGVMTFPGTANLMPGLPFGWKLYEMNHGKLEVAGVLPDGSLPSGGSGGISFFSGASGIAQHSVSSDGTRVLFMSPMDGSKPKQLYLRRDSSTTVLVSESESSTPNPEPRGVEYLDMTPDGKKVVFFSKDPLTDSDPGGGGLGIYIYTDGPDPEAEQNLTFVARIGVNETEAAGKYTGMSDDAKRIYFFSGETSELPQTGTYVWDEGTIRLVAPMSSPIGRRGFFSSGTEANISRDGTRMAFTYQRQLTEAPLGKEPNGDTLQAMYVYDEPTGELTCVSCLSSGAATTSAAVVRAKAGKGNGIGITLDNQVRFMSSDGKYVFFSTDDALVASDVNKLSDVYEYDAETGVVSLLSSGAGNFGSWFAGTSESGADTAIVTRDSYLAQDTDSLIDVYDVRIGGGFPQPKPNTGGCVGDECQGVPSAAPTFNTASGFVGLGNVAHRQTGGKAKAKGLTRAQKLARALKACKRKKGKARRRCVARARKRYGAKKASKSTSRAARG